MRRRLQSAVAKVFRCLAPNPDFHSELRATQRVLAEAQQQIDFQRNDARQFLSELIEAQAMGGSGPWQSGSPDSYARMSPVLHEALRLREAGPVSTLGVYGDYEFLLQNVNWQREINYSWMEFTRWGIQQIMLVVRLYYIKNPIIRRLVDVCAQYVWALGCDITSDDPDTNDQIKAFRERNQRVLGRCALMEAEKSKDRDG